MNPAALLLTASLAGCVLSPLPDMRTPADRARELTPRCEGFADVSSGPVTSRSGIDSVEPAYAHVATGNGSEQRLRGARIHVRPLPGATSQLLARSLECHESSVVLGKSETVVDDPFVLPNRWIDVDVDTEADGFVVLVRADSFEDAKRILERARRFASSSR
jgi:hypothetical protein